MTKKTDERVAAWQRLGLLGETDAEKAEHRRAVVISRNRRALERTRLLPEKREGEDLAELYEEACRIGEVQKVARKAMTKARELGFDYRRAAEIVISATESEFYHWEPSYPERKKRRPPSVAKRLLFHVYEGLRDRGVAEDRARGRIAKAIGDLSREKLRKLISQVVTDHKKHDPLDRIVTLHFPPFFDMGCQHRCEICYPETEDPDFT